MVEVWEYKCWDASWPAFRTFSNDDTNYKTNPNNRPS